MSDSSISPQGYIYGSEPMSVHPFWDNGGGGGGGETGGYVELERYTPDASATFDDILEHAHLGLPVEIAPSDFSGIAFTVFGGTLKEKQLLFDNQTTPYSMSMLNRTRTSVNVKGFYGYISDIHRDEDNPAMSYILCHGSMVIKGYNEYNVAYVSMVIHKSTTQNLIFSLCAGDVGFTGTTSAIPYAKTTIELPACNGSNSEISLTVGTIQFNSTIRNTSLLENSGAFCMYVPTEEQ